MYEPHPIAGPGKQVSEKSLELNVCAELLQHIRTWPGCERALWLGLTQQQERRTGLDELIRNVGEGFALMLQFKAPWPTSIIDDLYKFSINERQHEALEQIATQHPQHVHYVFPLYATWQKADRDAPDLARDTWLVPVSSVPLASLTAPPAPASGRHRVELTRAGAGMDVVFHSPRVNGTAINARDYFSQGVTQPDQALRSGIPNQALVDWVRSWDEPPSADQQPVGRPEKSLRFRGLNALYVPA